MAKTFKPITEEKLAADLAKRLRDLRKELPVAQLVKATGVSRGGYDDWEAALHLPSLRALLPIANHYGISVKELLP